MSREHELYLLTVQPVDDFFGNINSDFPININVISLSTAISYRSIFNVFPNKIADAINIKENENNISVADMKKNYVKETKFYI